jgi:hypothetical protein
MNWQGYERKLSGLLTTSVTQEPECSSPHSQHLASGPYSEPVEASLPKIHSDPIYALVFHVPNLYPFSGA